MQFTLTIELGNDAMKTGRDVVEAVERALAFVYRDTELSADPADSGRIRDINGNTVGQWEVRDAPVRLTNAERYGRDGSRALRLDPDALAAAE